MHQHAPASMRQPAAPPFTPPPQYSQHSYAVAQLETLDPATTAGMRFTPTFGIFRGGRKVDEVVGKEPQRLEDHLWLHADE
jgi:thioredoxin 1